MANNKSIYDVYFEAGASEGEYEASLSGIQDVWTGIESSRGDLAFDLARIGRTVDTLQAGTELISTVAGGFESREDFQKKDLIGAQTEIAKQAYERITKGDATALSWDELEKSKRTDFMAEYTPIKVGAGGKLWSQYTKMEQLWEKPLYRFGGEDVGHAYSKTDVQGISQFSKYGTPKLDVFQTIVPSLYDEATSSGVDYLKESGVNQYGEAELLRASREGRPPVNPVTKEPVAELPVPSVNTVNQNPVKNQVIKNKKLKKKDEIDLAKPYTLSPIY
jgi:hypothetical protein